MKKIIILGVFFAFFACMQAVAQVATSNCSEVVLTQIPAPPSPPSITNGKSIVIPNGIQLCNSNSNCCLLTSGLFDARRFFLQKMDNNGVFVVVSNTAVQTTVFSNLDQGTYRVAIQFPGVDLQRCNIPTDVISLFTAQTLGVLGTYASGTITVFTNEVVVGVPAQSDNQYTFLNGNQNLLLSTLFDPNEQIRINTSACKDFDEYQINIQEFWFGDVNQPGRWTSYAYVDNGPGGFFKQSVRPLKSVEDLRRVWDLDRQQNSTWEFIPGNSYRVQLTIRNSTCASWVDNLQTFFVCQPTWGCRNGVAETRTEPSISPNPVSRAFRVEGVAFNPVKSVTDQLVISDLTGRTVKNFSNVAGNEFDVSDLQTGVYFVSVLRNKHKMFTKKLVISR